MRAGTHTVGWSAKLGGALTPPLCRRLGSDSTLYLDSWIYFTSFTSCNVDLRWNKMVGRTTISAKNMALIDYLWTDSFDSEILPCGFVMQCKVFLIHVILFTVYVLNLPLNTQRPFYRSQCAGKWFWFWFMTDARYIVLPLILWDHCLDPTNGNISRVHCTGNHDIQLILTTMVYYIPQNCI